MEYLNLDFTKYVGSMIGTVQWLDWSIDIPRKLIFLRIRVNVRVDDPLLIGFHLNLDDGEVLRVQYNCECVF